MAIQTTYSDARARLAELWDQATSERETIIITRRGKEDVAMLPASELASLKETLHLLRSPRNAERLLAAIERSNSGLLTQVIDVDKIERSLEGGVESQFR